MVVCKWTPWRDNWSCAGPDLWFLWRNNYYLGLASFVEFLFMTWVFCYLDEDFKLMRAVLSGLRSASGAIRVPILLDGYVAAHVD